MSKLVDVAHVFSFVADVALLFEDAKRGADRRVARWIKAAAFRRRGRERR
jgi:hypothetical protein